MRILITGASGLLGSKIAELTAKIGYETHSGYQAHRPAYGIPVRLDVRDKVSLRNTFERCRPDAVIHAAALTDVDKCETDKELAWSVNVEGVRNIARLSKEYRAFLVYVSTDYVFRGDVGMYREDDEPDPVNYYGLTKLEGEREVMKEAKDFCIIRPSVIYGAKPASGKTNFALWVIEKLRKGEALRVVTDQWNSPTLNTNLAEMILEAVERRLTGIYHLAGATRISRYHFTKLIADTLGLNEELIKPVTMQEIKWAAPRPRDSSLDVSKAMKILRNRPNEIHTALRRLKEELA